MSQNRNQRVCPVEIAGALDTTLRRWLQNPEKLLSPYIKPGMSILDIGCGPGFFTIEMARLTGSTGHVVAADLQPGMLEKVRVKITETSLKDRITLHQCQQNTIGLKKTFDLILAFYVVHEIPDQSSFFRELSSLMKSGGKLLIIEPKFHVSKESFEKTIGILTDSGFNVLKRRSRLVNREVLATRVSLFSPDQG
ncbi:MAG: class I SAM-dependent methyltransferase [Bacteroidales bacterium]|nr:class I SAM-dependent methyltransferase [Bacteroidales bacterium]